MARFIHSQVNCNRKSLEDLTGQLPPDQWLQCKLTEHGGCPPEGGGVNKWHMTAVWHCRRVGLSLEQTLAAIRPHSNRRSRFECEIGRIYETSPAPLGDALDWRADGWASSPRPPKPPKPEPPPKPLAIPQSAMTPPNTAYDRATTGSFPAGQQALFALGEIFFCVTAAKPADRLLTMKSRINDPHPLTHDMKGWIRGVESITAGSDQGVWVCPNYSSGFKRGDILHRQLLVCECDDPNVSPSQQHRLLRSSGLPFIVIVHSGGKSVHGWCDIGVCQDDNQFKERGRRVYQTLEEHGLPVDWSCNHPNRVSRMPGGFRRETCREQTLLWSGCHGHIQW